MSDVEIVQNLDVKYGGLGQPASMVSRCFCKKWRAKTILFLFEWFMELGVLFTKGFKKGIFVVSKSIYFQ